MTQSVEQQTQHRNTDTNMLFWQTNIKKWSVASGETPTGNVHKKNMKSYISQSKKRAQSSRLRACNVLLCHWSTEGFVLLL